MIRFLQTPGPVKKYVLGGLLLLICVSMVWYLVPSGGSRGLGGPSQGVVAKVGGEEVTRLQVQRQTTQMQAAVSTRRRTNGDADAILCPACG